MAFCSGSLQGLAAGTEVGAGCTAGAAAPGRGAWSRCEFGGEGGREGERGRERGVCVEESDVTSRIRTASACFGGSSFFSAEGAATAGGAGAGAGEARSEE